MSENPATPDDSNDTARRTDRRGAIKRPPATDQQADGEPLLDTWGTRVVRGLLLVLPTVFLLGVLLQVTGVSETGVRDAAAVVGVLVALAGLLALAALVWQQTRTVREATRFEFPRFGE